MATFRGSGSVANGAAFPTEAELQRAIDEAEAAATAAAASQDAAEVNVTESETAQTNAETAQTAAEAAQALAEQAVVDAQAEVVLAAGQVALATTQAGLADDARIAAEAEVVLAAAQVTLATAQAVLADDARVLAETAKSDASAFAVIAEGHADDAEVAQTAAEAALDTFDDRYLGAKASDPALDNDGDPLITGALYWNTTTDTTMVYDGADWASLTGALTETEADLLYQPLDEELSDIAALAPTKGRLIAGNGSAWVDLGVGTNDDILTADSAETVGIKWAAPTPAAVTETYESGATTGWGNSTNYTFTHGLSGRPQLFQVYFQCKTAELGFAVGDRVTADNSYYVYGGAYRGSTTYANATVVGVTIDTSAGLVFRPDTIGAVAITAANWDLYATAIKW